MSIFILLTIPAGGTEIGERSAQGQPRWCLGLAPCWEISCSSTLGNPNLLKKLGVKGVELRSDAVMASVAVSCYRNVCLDRSFPSRIILCLGSLSLMNCFASCLKWNHFKIYILSYFYFKTPLKISFLPPLRWLRYAWALYTFHTLWDEENNRLI